MTVSGLPGLGWLPEGLLLAQPWALGLLALVPILIVARLFRATDPAARYGAGLYLELAGKSVRQRLTWLPTALRCVAVTALVVALARPQLGVGAVRTVTNGVAIMGLIDRSYSMSDTMDYDGERLTRLETVKRVFSEFVAGAERSPDDPDAAALRGRAGDMVGLVQFAGIAQTACPLVREHTTLLQLTDEVRLASSMQGDPEAGTAIGDALMLAIARLESAERDIARRGLDDELGAQAADPDFVIKSKVIVLLTDGDERNSEISASDAARIAAERGITIYAIGIGSEGGRFGFNPRLLRFIAEITGGAYWAASDADALRGVYAEIDELETTEVVSTEYTSREELFHWPLVVAGIALLLEVLLSATLLRRAGL